MVSHLRGQSIQLGMWHLKALMMLNIGRHPIRIRKLKQGKLRLRPMKNDGMLWKQWHRRYSNRNFTGFIQPKSLSKPLVTSSPSSLLFSKIKSKPLSHCSLLRTYKPHLTSKPFWHPLSTIPILVLRGNSDEPTRLMLMDSLMGWGVRMFLSHYHSQFGSSLSKTGMSILRSYLPLWILDTTPTMIQKILDLKCNDITIKIIDQYLKKVFIGLLVWRIKKPLWCNG